MASVWEELKRRNVVRVVIAYAVVSWLILQLTDVLMPILNLPEWVDGLIFLLLAIGFILAIIFSWVYELTPEGVMLEKDVERSLSVTHSTGHKLNIVIVALLSLSVLVFAVDRFFWTDSEHVAQGVEAAPIAESDAGPKKIAVLPFVNLSDNSDQEYFSDGLSEELLNLLAKIPQLQVTSRTSAFSFKDKDFTITEVGEQLDVDHVLEGSVRRSGDTIRITAQLIEVATDAHQWSETWDRKFEDVFVIQDEIAAHVVDALKLELLGDLPKAEQTTPEVYALVLQSQFLFRQGNAPSFRQAEVLLNQAIDLDPEYSQAWHLLGLVRYVGAAFGVGDRVDVMPFVHEAIDKALDLDPNNINARLLRADVAWAFDYDFELAASELEIAEELEPWNGQVHFMKSRLAYAKGEIRKAVELREYAHELDPLAGYRRSGATVYHLAGHVEAAMQYFEERAAVRPYADRGYSDWARAVLLEDDPDGALALLENEASDGHRTTVRALAYQTMGDTEQAREELDKLLALGNRWTYEIAQVYAYLGEPDEAFAWFDRAIERRDGSLAATVTDPFLDGIRDDPRFNDLLERLGRKQSF